MKIIKTGLETNDLAPDPNPDLEIDTFVNYDPNTNSYNRVNLSQYPLQGVYPLRTIAADDLISSAYTLAAADCQKTVLLSSEIVAPSHIFVELPPGWPLKEGGQTLFYASTSATLELHPLAGVTVNTLSPQTNIQPEELWCLMKLTPNNYIFYRIDVQPEATLPKATYDYGGLIEIPEVKRYPIFTATKNYLVKSITLKCGAASGTLRVYSDDNLLAGLSSLSASTTRTTTTANAALNSGSELVLAVETLVGVVEDLSFSVELEEA